MACANQSTVADRQTIIESFATSQQQSNSNVEDYRYEKALRICDRADKLVWWKAHAKFARRTERERALRRMRECVAPMLELPRLSQFVHMIACCSGNNRHPSLRAAALNLVGSTNENRYAARVYHGDLRVPPADEESGVFHDIRSYYRMYRDLVYVDGTFDWLRTTSSLRRRDHSIYPLRLPVIVRLDQTAEHYGRERELLQRQREWRIARYYSARYCEDGEISEDEEDETTDKLIDEQRRHMRARVKIGVCEERLCWRGLELTASSSAVCDDIRDNDDEDRFIVSPEFFGDPTFTRDVTYWNLFIVYRGRCYVFRVSFTRVQSSGAAIIESNGRLGDYSDDEEEEARRELRRRHRRRKKSEKTKSSDNDDEENNGESNGSDKRKRTEEEESDDDDSDDKYDNRRCDEYGNRYVCDIKCKSGDIDGNTFGCIAYGLYRYYALQHCFAATNIGSGDETSPQPIRPIFEPLRSEFSDLANTRDFERFSWVYDIWRRRLLIGGEPNELDMLFDDVLNIELFTSLATMSVLPKRDYNDVNIVRSSSNSSSRTTATTDSRQSEAAILTLRREARLRASLAKIARDTVTRRSLLVDMETRRQRYESRGAPTAKSTVATAAVGAKMITLRRRRSGSSGSGSGATTIVSSKSQQQQQLQRRQSSPSSEGGGDGSDGSDILLRQRRQYELHKKHQQQRRSERIREKLLLRAQEREQTRRRSLRRGLLRAEL